MPPKKSPIEKFIDVMKENFLLAEEYEGVFDLMIIDRELNVVTIEHEGVKATFTLTIDMGK